MLTMASLRLGLIVAAAIAVMGLVYFVFDAIGDAREAKVWAKVNAEIDGFNVDQDQINAADEETLALRAKVRASALAAGKFKSQCLLTAPEATTLGAIQ